MVEAPSSNGFGGVSSCKAGGDNVVGDPHTHTSCLPRRWLRRETHQLIADRRQCFSLLNSLFGSHGLTAVAKLHPATSMFDQVPSSSNEDGKVITSGVGKFHPQIRDQSCPCLTRLATDLRCMIIDKLARSRMARCRISMWRPSLAEMERILLGF